MLRLLMKRADSKYICPFQKVLRKRVLSPIRCCPEKWYGLNRISYSHWAKICIDHNSQINLCAKQKYKVLSDTSSIKCLYMWRISSSLENSEARITVSSLEHPCTWSLHYLSDLLRGEMRHNWGLALLSKHRSVYEEHNNEFPEIKQRLKNDIKAVSLLTFFKGFKDFAGLRHCLAPLHPDLTLTFFVLVFKKVFFFFCTQSYWIQIVFKRMYLTHRWNLNRVNLGVMAIKGGTTHFPELQDWSLTIRCNLVSYPGRRDEKS